MRCLRCWMSCREAIGASVHRNIGVSEKHLLHKRQQKIAGYREAEWKIVGIPLPPFSKKFSITVLNAKGGIGINSLSTPQFTLTSAPSLFPPVPGSLDAVLCAYR